VKVLVATSLTQGHARDDYCWTVDGELVLAGPILECSTPHRCGCGRGFPGLASCRATTTAMVVDRPDFDRSTLRIAIRESLDRQGWLAFMGPDLIADGLEDEIDCIEEITSAFPAGAIVVRHGTEVMQRASLAA